MKNKFILLTVMFGLLLAGCTSQEPSTPSAPSDTTSDSGTDGAESSDTGTTSDDSTSTDETTDGMSDTSEPEDTETSDSGADDFSGLDYGAAMALGLPGECDITTESEGQTFQVKVYFDGAGNARSEMPMDEAETGCAKFIVIQKTGKIYIGCQNSKYPPGTECDWMTMESEAEAGTSSMESEIEFGGSSLDTDYSDVPASKVSCKPWILDSSKFQASGKACTINDLMQGYTP
jgi:hypothetical protein